jgi:hypothetical protein
MTGCVARGARGRHLSRPSHRSVDVGQTEKLLAYVFWHWRQPSAAADTYEAAQLAFQRALAESPSVGFVRSFSHAIAGAPWANNGGEAYEDWYLVHDSAALDPLDEAAVTAGRRTAHDAAASLAAAGTAGLYQLRIGSAPAAPRSAQWFAKPAGMSYSQLFAAVEPALAPVDGSLWMRRMTLGPATEFCVLAREPAALAPQFQMVAFPLRPVWSDDAAQVARR